MKFPSFARLGLLSGSGFLGWLLHSMNVDGATNNTSLAMVAAALTAAFSLFGDFGTAWKSAGGKLDGHLTDAEARVINDRLIKPLSPKVSDFIAQNIGEATSLANWLFQYANRTFTIANEAVNDDQEHIQLMLAAHQSLSREVAGNTEGEAAALQILTVLQKQWNRSKPIEVTQ